MLSLFLLPAFVLGQNVWRQGYECQSQCPGVKHTEVDTCDWCGPDGSCFLRDRDSPAGGTYVCVKRACWNCPKGGRCDAVCGSGRDCCRGGRPDDLTDPNWAPFLKTCDGRGPEDYFGCTDGLQTRIAANVCFGATGKKPGVFTVDQDVVATQVRLLHRSGSVNCRGEAQECDHGMTGDSAWNGLHLFKGGKAESNWGCECRSWLAVYMTDADDNVMLPKGPSPDPDFETEESKRNGKTGWYNNLIDKYHSHSDLIAFDETVTFEAGKEYKIWYGEDLYDVNNGDNIGEACIDIHITQAPTAQPTPEPTPKPSPQPTPEPTAMPIVAMPDMLLAEHAGYSHKPGMSTISLRADERFATFLEATTACNADPTCRGVGRMDPLTTPKVFMLADVSGYELVKAGSDHDIWQKDTVMIDGQTCDRSAVLVNLDVKCGDSDAQGDECADTQHGKMYCAFELGFCGNCVACPVDHGAGREVVTEHILPQGFRYGPAVVLAGAAVAVATFVAYRTKGAATEEAEPLLA